MKNYLDLLEQITETGKLRADRTGTGTIGIFGKELRFDMAKGFPLLTTKKTHLKSIIHELLWFLKGSDNIQYLHDNGVTIWDEWADENGDLGPIYGYQWRKWRKYVPAGEGLYKVEHIDQIANLINKLKTNPDDRRMIVSAWNVAEIDDMNLPPCHHTFHVSTFELTLPERLKIYRSKNLNTPIGYINNDVDAHARLDGFDIPRRSISLLWIQRSVDTFLGLPFNIASYALLLQMIAQVVNMVPDELICCLGDTHLYKNHLDQTAIQMSREPRVLPRMVLNPAITNIDDFKFEDFDLQGYDPHPSIKADISK